MTLPTDYIIFFSSSDSIFVFTTVLYFDWIVRHYYIFFCVCYDRFPCNFTTRKLFSVYLLEGKETEEEKIPLPCVLHIWVFFFSSNFSSQNEKSTNVACLFLAYWRRQWMCCTTECLRLHFFSPFCCDSFSRICCSNFFSFLRIKFAISVVTHVLQNEKNV